MITGDSEQFIWAMWDSGKAALVGVNLVPVVVISLFVGMVAGSRGHFWLKALIALVPAVFVVALWPMTSGYQPIWPDVTELEAEMQILMQFGLAWAIILVVALFKNILSFGPARSGRHKVV